jgi:hypothetical protein
MVVCEICGKECKSLKGLGPHVSRIHKITSEEYYLKYIGEQKYCYCGEKTKFISLGEGFFSYCSVKCMTNSKNINDKKKQTNLERRGVEYPGQSKKVKEKMKETNLKVRGVEYPGQSEEVKEKIKQTCRERFGVDHPMKNEKFKEKIKQTCRERFGCDNPLENKEVIEKRKETNKKKYGNPHSPQTKKVKETRKKTNEKKYGVLWVTQDKKIREKMKQTQLITYTNLAEENLNKYDIVMLENYIKTTTKMKFRCKKCNSEFEDRGFNILKRVHKCPVCDPFYISHLELEVRETISEYLFSKFDKKFELIFNDRKILEPYEIDILIPELNLSIEVNGDYWHGFEKIEQRDIEKSILLIEKGYKHFVIREFEWDQIRDYTFEKLNKLLEIDFETYQENISYFTGFEL